MKNYFYVLRVPLSIIACCFSLLCFSQIIGCGSNSDDDVVITTLPTTYSVSGNVVLPTTYSATSTANIRLQVAQNLTAKLVDATDVVFAGPVSVNSVDGSFIIPSIKAGSNYRLFIVSSSGNVLLQKYYDSFSSNIPSETVNDQSTAIAILVQSSSGTKTATQIKDAVSKATISLTSLTTTINNYLSGLITTTNTNILDVVVQANGVNAISELVNKVPTTDTDNSTLTSNFRLVDTGQVICYDTSNATDAPALGAAFYGQDAQFSGRQPSYSLSSSNLTVTDNNTGLMWQKSPSSSHYNWLDAKAYCESLELDGHSDWRMPTLKELFSISDFSTGWPYLNTTYFDLAGTDVSKDEQYWGDNYYVGTTVEGQSDAAFGVNHGTGHIKAYPALVSGPMAKRVRAVRGNVYGENKLVNNADGTITDQATSLMWSQNDSLEPMDWEHALAYAQTKNTESYLGHNDWRLPNVKELQSIVDYTRSPSATDATKKGPAIDPMFNCTSIKIEANEDDYPYYWTNTSALFQKGQPYYYAWYVAFGMAVNGEGKDFHGAGAVRFDTKVEGGPAGEGGERYYNYVRLVREVK